MRDPAAVEPHTRADLATRRHEERDPAAEAEPHDADAVVAEARPVQVLEGGVDVHQHAVVGEALEERHHLAEVVVGSGAAAGAVEDRRRDRVVALVGEATGDVFDVVVHPEGFLDHDDRGLGLRPVGSRFVDLHRTVGRGQLDRLRRHVTPAFRYALAPSDSAAICTALMIPW